MAEKSADLTAVGMAVKWVGVSVALTVVRWAALLDEMMAVQMVAYSAEK